MTESKHDLSEGGTFCLASWVRKIQELRPKKTVREIDERICFECDLDLPVCSFGKDYCDHYIQLEKQRVADRLISAIDRLSSALEKIDG